jgi:hypothetical protein
MDRSLEKFVCRGCFFECGWQRTACNPCEHVYSLLKNIKNGPRGYMARVPGRTAELRVKSVAYCQRLPTLELSTRFSDYLK